MRIGYRYNHGEGQNFICKHTNVRQKEELLVVSYSKDGDHPPKELLPYKEYDWIEVLKLITDYIIHRRFMYKQNN